MIAIAVVLVVVIAALGSGAEPETSLASPSPGANSAVTQRPSTPRPTVAAAPTATPEPTPPPTPEPTAAPAFAQITLTGSGSKVAKFTIPEDAAAIASITSSGASNFAVWAVAADGVQNQLLVNVIGRYAGTVLFDVSFGEHSVAFEIEASGSWQIVVQPVTAARVWEAGAAGAGTGDDVLLLEEPPTGLVVSTIKHTGTSNFAIWSYSLDGADLLANEIGAYSGEVIIPPGTYVLAITADGAWSLTSPS